MGSLGAPFGSLLGFLGAQRGALARFWGHFGAILVIFLMIFVAKWDMRELHPLSSENQIFEGLGGPESLLCRSFFSFDFKVYFSDVF